MSSPMPQDTVNGFHVGDKVGYISKHRQIGYTARIIEVHYHEPHKNRSLVKIQLDDNGAYVDTWDKDLAFIPHSEE